MRLRAVNEQGRLIGEGHGRAKVSDLQVDEIRDLYEDEGWTLVDLALWFGLSMRGVHRIVNYEVRAQTPVAWRKNGKTIR